MTRRLSDAKELRALAHPTRMAAIELLGREGPLTATQLGELLDESPANMSFHLRTLAKAGFVEEASGGTGRERPWQRVRIGEAMEIVDEEAAMAAMTLGLTRSIAQRAFDRRNEWELTRSTYDSSWRQAAFEHFALTYLTADELDELGQEMLGLLQRFADRVADRDRRPAGSLPVAIQFHGHPIPPTPAGN